MNHVDMKRHMPIFATKHYDCIYNDINPADISIAICNASFQHMKDIQQMCTKNAIFLMATEKARS